MQRTKPFAQVPHAAITDHRLSFADRGIYSYPCMRQGQNDCAWPSRATIARDLGTSESTVKRSLRTLAELGYVAVKSRLGRSNLYQIQEPEVETPKAENAAKPTFDSAEDEVTCDPNAGSPLPHDVMVGSPVTPTRVTHEPTVGSPMNLRIIRNEKETGREREDVHLGAPAVPIEPAARQGSVAFLDPVDAIDDILSCAGEIEFMKDASTRVIEDHIEGDMPIEGDSGSAGRVGEAVEQERQKKLHHRRSYLQDHFERLSGNKCPKASSKRQAKKRRTMWYNPLEEILELCELDLDKAENLVRDALDDMAKKELSVSNPRSILKPVQGLIAKAHLAKTLRPAASTYEGGGVFMAHGI